MDVKPRAAAGSQRVYEDFVPPHELHKEDGAVPTFVVRLPGFKREQMRVQIDNYGKLRISGERPLGDNRWRRFRKDYQVPDTCNVSEVRAKFQNDVLEVTLPNLIPEPRSPPRPPAQPPQMPKESQKPATETKPSAAPDDTKLKAPAEPDGAAAKKQPEEKKTERIEERRDSQKVEEEKEKDRSREEKPKEKVAAGADEEGEKGGGVRKEETAPEPAAAAGVGDGVGRFKRKVGELGLGFYRPRHFMVNVVVAAVVLVGVGMFLYYKLGRAVETGGR